MSATDEMCRLLNERGVKWTSERVSDGVLFTFAKDGRTYSVFVRDRAGLEIWSNYLTPAQAIATTLGSGTLTAEQVSRATYAHSIHADCADADWQAIADELNATLGSDDTFTREDVEGAFVSGYSLGLDMFDSSKPDSEKGWNQNERNLDEEMEDLGWVRKDAATLGAGTCHYSPDDVGFTWWDENDVEHCEEYSASYECCSASCDKCGYTMMVGDEGWFDGWDEITEWWEEDGSYHKGYVLRPRFKHCPNCGRKVVGE